MTTTCTEEYGINMEYITQYIFMMNTGSCACDRCTITRTCKYYPYVTVVYCVISVIDEVVYRKIDVM